MMFVFGLFKMTGGLDVTSIDLVEIGDANHCRTIRARMVHGGTPPGVLQVHPIAADGPIWANLKFQIRVVGVGSLAYCNSLAGIELGEKSKELVEPQTQDQIDIRILTRFVDGEDEWPLWHASDYYMGRLSLNRTVWNGDVKANPYAVKEAPHA